MFGPVETPTGRLLRLAVVIDPRNPPARIEVGYYPKPNPTQPSWVELEHEADLTLSSALATGILLSGELAERESEWLRLVTAACAVSTRDPATMALALEVPLSIGRTEA